MRVDLFDFNLDKELIAKEPEGYIIRIYLLKYQH